MWDKLLKKMQTAPKYAFSEKNRSRRGPDAILLSSCGQALEVTSVCIGCSELFIYSTMIIQHLKMCVCVYKSYMVFKIKVLI